VIVAPLLAAVLLWLCNRKDIMGEDRNGPLINVLGVVGFVLLLVMAGNTAFKSIPDKLKNLRATTAQPVGK
jgi:Mn2+/Fe2+ NRAMP family transporter